MRLRVALALVASSAVWFAGCGENSKTTTLSTGGSTTNLSVAVTPATAQSVDAGQSLALTATVTNDSGSKGVTWAVSAGGGSLASTAGATNTYTAPAVQASNVVITATSVADATKSATVGVTVYADPVITTSAPLANGVVGTAYSTTIPAVGGQGAISFQLVSGTLPAGLALSAAGVLSGTPTAAGTSTFTVQVTDSAAMPFSTRAQLSLAVAAAPLTISTQTLPGAIAGVTYAGAQLSSTGNSGAVTYVVASGSLPAGLALSAAGAISGTPTAAGTSTFTVRATDSSGQTATQPFSILTASRLTLGNVALPAATANQAIPSVQLQAQGGASPYTYAVASGSTLPAGLSLSSAGLFSGTPTTAGSYSFNVVATDSGSTNSGSATPPQQQATAAVTLTVRAASTGITIAPGTLPNAIPNSPYSQTLTASGATGSTTFSLVSGTLPTGLSLKTTGVIDGQPTGATGAYTFTVKATDASGNTGQQAITLAVSNTLSAGPNNNLLRGSYAFLFQGNNNGSSGTNVYGTASVGQMVFDGGNTVTGTLDVNAATTGYSAQLTFTGSYTINSDNRGMLVYTLTGSTQPNTFTVVLQSVSSGPATQFRLLRFDDQDPGSATGVTGVGMGALQTGTYATAAPTGSYVLAQIGETCSGCNVATTDFGPLAQVGALNLAGGAVATTGSKLDTRLTTNLRSLTPAGTFALSGGGNGRGTLTLTDPNGTAFPGQPLGYVFYAVSPTEFYLLSTNAHNGGYALLSGTATLRTAGTLNGTGLAYVSGNLAGDGATGFSRSIGARVQRFVTSGTSVSTSGYQVLNGTPGTTQAGTGATVTTDATLGTAQFTDTDGTPYTFYLTGQNSGYSLGLGTVRGVVRLDAQTTTTFSPGLYTFATQAAPTNSYGFLGSLNATGTSSTAGTAVQNEYYVLYDGAIGGRLFRVANPVTVNYVTDATTGFIQFGTTGQDYRGFVISDTKVVNLLDQAVGNVPLTVYEK